MNLKNFFKNILPVLLLVGLFSGFTNAQNVYVNSTNGNDFYDGSSNTISGSSGPFKTFEKAVNAVGDGGTIYMYAGEYRYIGSEDDRSISMPPVARTDDPGYDGDKSFTVEIRPQAGNDMVYFNGSGDNKDGSPNDDGTFDLVMGDAETVTFVAQNGTEGVMLGHDADAAFQASQITNMRLLSGTLDVSGLGSFVFGDNSTDDWTILVYGGHLVDGDNHIVEFRNTGTVTWEYRNDAAVGTNLDVSPLDNSAFYMWPTVTAYDAGDYTAGAELAPAATADNAKGLVSLDGEHTILVTDYDDHEITFPHDFTGDVDADGGGAVTGLDGTTLIDLDETILAAAGVKFTGTIIAEASVNNDVVVGAGPNDTQVDAFEILIDALGTVSIAHTQLEETGGTAGYGVLNLILDEANNGGLDGLKLGGSELSTVSHIVSENSAVPVNLTGDVELRRLLDNDGAGSIDLGAFNLTSSDGGIYDDDLTHDNDNEITSSTGFWIFNLSNAGVHTIDNVDGASLPNMNFVQGDVDIPVAGAPGTVTCGDLHINGGYPNLTADIFVIDGFDQNGGILDVAAAGEVHVTEDVTRTSGDMNFAANTCIWEMNGQVEQTLQGGPNFNVPNLEITNTGTSVTLEINSIEVTENLFVAPQTFLNLGDVDVNLLDVMGGGGSADVENYGTITSSSNTGGAIRFTGGVDDGHKICGTGKYSNLYVILSDEAFNVNIDHVDNPLAAGSAGNGVGAQTDVVFTGRITHYLGGIDVNALVTGVDLSPAPATGVGPFPEIYINRGDLMIDGTPDGLELLTNNGSWNNDGNEFNVGYFGTIPAAVANANDADIDPSGNVGAHPSNLGNNIRDLYYILDNDTNGQLGTLDAALTISGEVHIGGNATLTLDAADLTSTANATDYAETPIHDIQGDIIVTGDAFALVLEGDGEVTGDDASVVEGLALDYDNTGNGTGVFDVNTIGQVGDDDQNDHGYFTIDDATVTLSLSEFGAADSPGDIFTFTSDGDVTLASDVEFPTLLNADVNSFTQNDGSFDFGAFDVWMNDAGATFTAEGGTFAATTGELQFRASATWDTYDNSATDHIAVPNVFVDPADLGGIVVTTAGGGAAVSAKFQVNDDETIADANSSQVSVGGVLEIQNGIDWVHNSAEDYLGGGTVRLTGATTLYRNNENADANENLDVPGIEVAAGAGEWLTLNFFDAVDDLSLTNLTLTSGDGVNQGLVDVVVDGTLEYTEGGFMQTTPASFSTATNWIDDGATPAFDEEVGQLILDGANVEPLEAGLAVANLAINGTVTIDDGAAGDTTETMEVQNSLQLLVAPKIEIPEERQLLIFADGIWINVEDNFLMDDGGAPAVDLMPVFGDNTDLFYTNAGDLDVGPEMPNAWAADGDPVARNVYVEVGDANELQVTKNIYISTLLHMMDGTLDMAEMVSGVNTARDVTMADGATVQITSGAVNDANDPDGDDVSLLGGPINLTYDENANPLTTDITNGEWPATMDVYTLRVEVTDGDVDDDEYLVLDGDRTCGTLIVDAEEGDPADATPTYGDGIDLNSFTLDITDTNTVDLQVGAIVSWEVDDQGTATTTDDRYDFGTLDLSANGGSVTSAEDTYFINVNITAGDADLEGIFTSVDPDPAVDPELPGDVTFTLTGDGTFGAFDGDATVAGDATFNGNFTGTAEVTGNAIFNVFNGVAEVWGTATLEGDVGGTISMIHDSLVTINAAQAAAPMCIINTGGDVTFGDFAGVAPDPSAADDANVVPANDELTINITGDSTSTVTVPEQGTDLAELMISKTAQNMARAKGNSTVAIENTDAYVELVGGNLFITDLLTFDNGVLVATEGTAVQLSPANEGVNYNRDAVDPDNAEFGHVVGDLTMINLGAAVGRFPYPVGSMNRYAPTAITLRETFTSGGSNVTFSYSAEGTSGKVNLPLEDAVAEGVNISRYPDFYWNVKAKPTVAPFDAFDLELTGPYFTDFDDINNIRMLRRRGTGVDSTNQWLLQGTATAYDNEIINNADWLYPDQEFVTTVIVNQGVGGLREQAAIFTYGIKSNLSVVGEIASPDTVFTNTTKEYDLSGLFAGFIGDPTYDAQSSNVTVAQTSTTGSTLSVTALEQGNTLITVYGEDENSDFIATTFDVVVMPGMYDITGTVTYGNDAATPLEGTVVSIGTKSGAVAADGSYTVAGVQEGTYTPTFANSMSWGGVTGGDVLLVREHNEAASLTEASLLAADVNDDGVVDVADVQQMRLRIIRQLDAFAAGDFVYYDAASEVTVLADDVTADFTALATGDINGSYSFAAAKAAPVLSLEETNLEVNPAREVIVPFSVQNDLSLNSFTFWLDFPAEQLEFEGFASPANDVTYAVKDGKIGIVWESLEALKLKAGQDLFTLKFKQIGKLEVGTKLEFNVDPASEITDMRSVLAGTKITVPSVEIAVPKEFALRNNYPNPFNPSTTIEYDLPVNGTVTLAIFNILGEKVATVVNDVQTAGAYAVEFNASNLASGMYIYNLRVSGENGKSFSQSHKMMLMK